MNSRYTIRAILRIAACATICLVIMAVAAQSKSNLTVQLDADSTRADGPNGVIEFSGITITQGDLSVRADKAKSSGLDFENSAWTFSGDVEFRSADTNVTASKAVLRFRSQRLSDATLEGAPLSFALRGNSNVRLSGNDARLEFSSGGLVRAYFRGQPVRFEQEVGERVTSARADSIVYNAAGGMVILQDNAWIGEAGREITGNRIQYNFLQQIIVAASDESGQQGVRITITPPEERVEPQIEPEPQLQPR